MSKQPLRLGIAGLGTVGSGVIKMLLNNANLLSLRAGRQITISAVSAKSRTKKSCFKHLYPMGSWIKSLKT